MSTYKLTTHVQEHLTGSRPFMTKELLIEIARYLPTIVDRFSPDKIHQVAVKVWQYDKPREMGKSEGDCLIIMVDIRKKTIPTAFLRYARQGSPRMAQVYIDFDGNIIN